MQAAASNRTSLRIRGHGSKDFYGQQLQGDILDLSGYSGIVDYEPTELVITARAGTPISDIEAALAAAGQVLAFEPPRFGGAGTIGGAIAAGLSGPRRAYAGSARDFVLGVQALDGRGDKLSFGGQVIKNVAGFDVSRLMTGALGTLGVLLEVSLKTLPKPAGEATLRLALNEERAIRTMNEWAAQPLPLSATCYHDGLVTVRLSGAQSAVRAGWQKLGGQLVDDAELFWTGLRDQSGDFFRAAKLWRLSLPSTTAPLDLPAPQLIEWGGAQRWLSGEIDALELRAKAAALGGHATLFRAADKSAGVFHPLALEIAVIQQRLKAALDPHGIFNRGRMYLKW